MQRVLPFVLGALGAAACGSLAWLLVGRGLREWESGAFAAGAEFSLVIFAAVVGGVVAFVLSWGRLVGPALDHAGFSLVFPGGALAQVRRPTAGRLRAALSPLGYVTEVAILDDAEQNASPAGDDSPLGGRPVRLLLSGAPPRAGRLVLRVPPDGEGAAGTEIALGFVDAHGVAGGAYEELAGYVIAALGRLYPGLRFKRMDSGLDEQPTEDLQHELPDRPLRISSFR